MSFGTLYLIPTSISEGEVAGIPEQVRTQLKRLDYFLVENVRTARRYISSLKLGLIIEELDFQELSKKTSGPQVEHLMMPVMEGKSVGILSESGCPGVADPGARAVEFAHKHGIKVVPLVGPSSILLALMASGLNGQKFAFHGYLPIKVPELQQVIKSLERSSVKEGYAHIFIETPYRNNQLLENLSKIAHPETMLCVAKDLTGQAEFIRTLPLKMWKKEKVDLHKTPCIFILQAALAS
ncbi:MAG: SAM-dependent methyltransferase [Bacteroidota bacterium]